MNTRNKPNPVLMIVCLVLVLIFLLVLRAHPEWNSLHLCGCR